MRMNQRLFQVFTRPPEDRSELQLQQKKNNTNTGPDICSDRKQQVNQSPPTAGARVRDVAQQREAEGEVILKWFILFATGG